MNCSDFYKTERVQDLQTKAMRRFLDMLIKEYGGLPANAAADFQTGYRKGFMAECKKKKKEDKQKNSKPKSKTRRR
jgi:hypothetical protein|uniref:Uncharacterized protein n=1 Tax=viral metagenome TaxID=1070528 RepID=A0A6C0AGL0_9ZZZZ